LATSRPDKSQGEGFMGTDTTIVLGLVIGSVGMGYVVYGRRQHRSVALWSGVGLCTYPYFVSNILAFIGIGIVLIAAPFFVNE
jgi:hypothetical protein